MDPKLAMEDGYSKELLQAVGILFLTAAATETLISFEVLRVLSHPRAMDPNLIPAISGMEVGVKLGIVRVTAAMHKPHCGPAISRATTKLQDAFEHRNNIAHNFGRNAKTEDHITLTQLRLTPQGKMRPEIHYHARQIRMFSYLLQQRGRALDEALTEAGFAKLPKQKLPKQV